MKTLVLIFVVFCVTAAASKKTNNVEQEHEHYHDTDGDGTDEHDPKYDQEAFLGDKAKDFEKLSKEEGIKKLDELIETKVDKNKDGTITREELTEWLVSIQNTQQNKEVNRTWADYNMTDDSLLEWNDYASSMIPQSLKNKNDAIQNMVLDAVESAKKATGIESKGIKISLPEGEKKNQAEADDFVQRLSKDERRWKTADLDNDGKLNKQEYTTFLYPDNYEHMKKVLSVEALETLDRDGDGKVSQDEYIKDLWDPQNEEKNAPPPDWLKDEVETFKNKRDANKDGYLDLQEIQDWMFPAEDKESTLAIAQEEADHLIKNADVDKNGQLTKEEIINKYDFFAGSGVTNYGDEIGLHDEL